MWLILQKYVSTAGILLHINHVRFVGKFTRGARFFMNVKNRRETTGAVPLPALGGVGPINIA